MITEIVNRRSVRSYKSTPVKKEDVVEIIKAAQYSPSGRHSRAWEFVIVNDKKEKDEIYKLIGQEFIQEAPVLIVPAVDTKKTNLGMQDLAIASENIFLQATQLGLGTVWKNLDTEWANKVKKILNIPDHFLVINIIPLGYPKDEIGPHNEKEDFESSKIHWGKW